MSIKRQLVVAALLAVPLLGLFFWWGFRTPPFSIINGRTLVDWLREVEFEGFQHKVAANEVLYAAGPKIIPTLSRVLRQPDFPLMARLPSAWIPESMRARDSDQKKIRANAAWVISVIVHRNPDCPESLSAVPSLIAGLSSHSQQVRYVSEQGRELRCWRSLQWQLGLALIHNALAGCGCSSLRSKMELRSVTLDNPDSDEQ